MLVYFLKENTGFAVEYWQILLSILMFKLLDRGWAMILETVARWECAWAGRIDHFELQWQKQQNWGGVPQKA